MTQRLQKGFVHLTAIFVLAILLLATAWIANQRTQSSSMASSLPQDFYGIVRKNNFYDCESGYRLVNSEEDEVVHCLVVPPEGSTKNLDLSEFVNQDVKVYGKAFKLGKNRHIIVSSIEKSSGPTSFADKMLNALGAFIKKFTSF